MDNKETLEKILSTLESVGAEIFVVGGPIRDKILGIIPKDIDFLVRKVTLEQISNAINKIGKAGEVGQSFGIVKGVVHGQEFDFAIPRIKEIKTGNSHTDFSVQTDPNATIEADLSRRDFTINSMALPLRNFINNDLSGLIDPHNGLEDIKNKVIRTVGNPFDRFSEDSLRILRAIQFSSRLGFTISQETKEAIKE
jgi:tRNA nucleotidyltransferase (CCA-adding enzyme)